jgi:hypothetical protein
VGDRWKKVSASGMMAHGIKRQAYGLAMKAQIKYRM